MPSDRSTPSSRRAKGATSAPQRPFHNLHPARRDDATVEGRNPPAWLPRALARDTTTSRASLRSSPQNCQKCLDEGIRRAFGHIFTGAGRQRMPRNRIPRLLFKPLFENPRRIIDLAQRAMRQCQQLASFGVLRPERNRLAVARGGFFGPLQPAEQHAQVGVCTPLNHLLHAPSLI